MTDLLSLVATLILVWGGAIVGLAVGAAYFIKADRDAAVSVRMLTSAFGPSLALLFVLAGLLWPDQYRYKPAGVQAYVWLQLVPFVLLTITLIRYPGNQRLHLLLVPLGLLAWGWTFAMGWIFVHGK